MLLRDISQSYHNINNHRLSRPYSFPLLAGWEYYGSITHDGDQEDRPKEFECNNIRLVFSPFELGRESACHSELRRHWHCKCRAGRIILVFRQRWCRLWWWREPLGWLGLRCLVERKACTLWKKSRMATANKYVKTRILDRRGKSESWNTVHRRSRRERVFE